MADSTGASLSYRDVLLRAVVLGRLLRGTVGPAPYVGLLLPPLVPTAIANLALTLIGKIPVNLNYTASQALVDSSIQQCGITHVLTSRRVIDRFGITPKATLLFLEDLPGQVTRLEKVIGAVVARLVPIAQLGRFLPGLNGDHLDQTATVVFTSGSTGDPKGVVLSNRNVLSNVHQVNHHIGLLPDESILGILPFFHSFGFTVTIWIALCLGKRVAYHFSPLDARIVGELVEAHKLSMLIATPTFMRTYLKKCEPKQFASLVHILLGAEKVPPRLSREIRTAIGIEPLEGYGTTELSPVVSLNVPEEVTLPDGRRVSGNHLGTVGRLLPGTEVKTVDPDSGEDLPPRATGLILVRGPQVMVGYLNRPDATAKVVKNGWYNTGDLGFIDDEGFLHITDRLSRFSKIGGEMVPHMGVESAIQEVLGAVDPCVAVTALPDPKRGERLFVLYTPEMTPTPQEVVRRLQGTDMPRLWIPSSDDFIAVEQIPMLGQGKVDLKGLKEVASERTKVAV
jgi:acyl-[acyl-carrier-protein]-phospholipid O-acyltransferase/long-chain-fatty-acid--[acyl-carrier-protein] ligase